MTWLEMLRESNTWPNYWWCREDFQVLLVRQVLGMKVFEERIP